MRHKSTENGQNDAHGLSRKNLVNLKTIFDMLNKNSLFIVNERI